MSACICLLLSGMIANLHPAVAQAGPSCHRGCLIQYNEFDPCRPTIVITHGFNPMIKHIHLTHAPMISCAIRRRCGDRFNLMGWDWNNAAFDYLSGRRNTNMAIWQGQLLACRLRALGVRPESTWLIGHSLGAVVMSKAACDLRSAKGCRVAQLTMLDAVGIQHRIIFGRFAATRNCCHIENYWAGGLSGVGRPSLNCDVYSYRVRGGKPCSTCWFAPRGNHAYAVEWYYNSICRSGPGFSRGLCCFQRPN
jgi:pimeloyl-ACP methyl ester carboxylesterase